MHNAARSTAAMVRCEEIGGSAAANHPAGRSSALICRTTPAAVAGVMQRLELGVVEDALQKFVAGAPGGKVVGATCRVEARAALTDDARATESDRIGCGISRSGAARR
jgi:hypothetical protein